MTILSPTRRGLLQSAAGLVVGVMLPARGLARSGAEAVVEDDADAVFSPNAFVRVGADDTVTVLIKHIEFGQGPYTGLATLVAEEMDADWSQMRATAAPADVALYANTAFGLQGTGGSTAMANSYIQMRKAGAAARAMLVEAAARTWAVPADEITVARGVVAHAASGRSSGFGALAEAARDSAVPQDPPVKDPADFVLIGTRVPRLDSAAKSTGRADFTIDVVRDGMLTVAVAHPPAFGATVASFDAEAAMAVEGVTKVAAVPSGVAVYATDTWAALQGRQALTVDWDESAAETRSSDEMMAAWSEAAAKPATVAERSGDVDAAFAGAQTVLDAEFRFPFLAHAPLEPLDAVLEYRGDSAELWMGSQLQTVDHQVLAGVLGLDPARVAVHTQLAGGSFGRRAQPDGHPVAEVAEIARAGGPGAYKLLWSREDDIRGGYYRPLTVHRLKGGLDAKGDIVAWENTIANQSIVAGTPFAALLEDGVDATSIEGSTRMPYAWPAHRVSWARMEAGVPVLWWRSVGHTHTAYATEVFLDELLAAAGRDPVEGRLALLKPGAGRDRGVLERVAEMAGWSGSAAGEGRTRGVALHESFGSYVAMIAEVSDDGGLPRVHRVWVAVDCGRAVNPDIVTAQMEGGTGFGLGHALYSEITLEEGGRVAQSNFDTYRTLRMPQMPRVEVSIVDSDADPTGVGEPGVPPIAPAVGNAWRALTGRAPRRLPFASAGGRA